MDVIAIESEANEAYFGPFIDPALADIVLGIIKEAVDDEAELVIYEGDPYKAQLKAGLRPFKICVELDANGKVVEKKVELTWPPHVEEGIYDDRDFYKEIFVWAKSKGDAIMRLPAVQKGRRDN